MEDKKKSEVKKEVLTNEELKVIVQILNQPRQQDLQTANGLIQLVNKISRIIDQV